MRITKFILTDFLTHACLSLRGRHLDGFKPISSERISTEWICSSPKLSNSEFRCTLIPVNPTSLSEADLNAIGINGNKAIKFDSSYESYLNILDPMLDQGTFTVSFSFWIKGLIDEHLFHAVGIPYRSFNNTYILAMKNIISGFIAGNYGLHESAFAEMSLAHSSINPQQWKRITITSTYSSVKDTIKLSFNGEYMVADTESLARGYLQTGTWEKVRSHRKSTLAKP